MKKISITYKLFTITFIFGLSLLLMIHLFLSNFFEEFYKQKKLKSIENNINTFAQEYIDKRWGDERLYREIDKFNEQNNVILDVVSLKESSYYILGNNSMVEEYYAPQNVTVEDESGMHLYITIDSMGEDLLIDNSITIGDKFYVEGFFEDANNQTLYPTYISYEETPLDETIEGMYSGYVKVLDVEEIPLDMEFEEIEFESFMNTYMDEQEIVKINKDFFYTIYKQPYSNVMEAIFYKTFELENNDEKIIVVNASLQSISEVMLVLKDYYIYFYVIAIILILLLTLLYSKWISKPLVKMNRVANKMSKMDFSETSSIHSNDELGSLSNNLNLLSSNLDRTLNELKDTNKKLGTEIEKVKKEEHIRKEFVANVSHELKTPLGIIKSYSEAIKDGINKEKKEYYLDVIINEIEKMNQLVLDMLELSKIELKATKLKKSEVDIKELIIEVINILEMPIYNKNLTIDLEGDYFKVNADYKKILQVVLNLLSNAVKYSLENTQILINGKVMKDKYYIYIQNTCGKIDKEEIEKLWLRFYKLDKAHNREMGGTGLGLAIVKAILELHQSDFGIENDEDNFIFYFSLEKIK